MKHTQPAGRKGSKNHPWKWLLEKCVIIRRKNEYVDDDRGSVEIAPDTWLVGGKSGYIVHDPDGPQG